MKKTDKLMLTFEELEEYLSQIWAEVNNCQESLKKTLDVALLELGREMMKNNYDSDSTKVVEAIIDVKYVNGQILALEKASTKASAKIHTIIQELDAEETAKQNREKQE